MNVLREQGYVYKQVITGNTASHTHVNVKVDVAELFGAEIMLYAQLNSQTFIARVDANFNVEAGQPLQLDVNMEKVHFFDAETEQRIILS